MKVTCELKFRQGDIVTLKAMVRTPENGPPQRMAVVLWEVTSAFDANGDPQLEDIWYWCRVLACKEPLLLTPSEQQFMIGGYSKAGLAQVAECELELYVAADAEKE